jgi:pSer/pThr/pTyr-binding forkhead associated (FHA) protein
MSSEKRVVPSHVTIILADLADRQTHVQSLPFIIGRHGSDFNIEHSQVSDRHAALDLVGGAIQIADLGSAHGTFVNGFRITQATALKNGDEIVLGTLPYRILIAVARSPHAPATPDPNAMTVPNRAAPKAAPIGEERRVVLTADTAGKAKQFHLDKRITTVGRGECDVTILDPLMSRKHLQIEVYGEGFGLKDLASANGTYVNGKPISYLRVPSDVTFKAGDTTFHLFLE